MSGSYLLKLAGIVLALAGLSVLSVWVKGGLYLSNYEGDTLHLADIVLRLAGGQTQHIDFSTPLGGLSFAPIAWLVSAGLPLGKAFVLGQGLMALVLGIALVRAAAVRLPPLLGYTCVAILTGLMVSLTHGQSGSMTAISMHYNRWAWVLAFALVILAVLPPRNGARASVDGVIIGLGLVALAFLKITYFVAFAPYLLVVLLIGQRWQMLGAGVLAGLLASAALAAFAWPALAGYLADLMAVRAGDVRASPGLTLQSLVVSPPYFIGVVATVAGAMFLRSSGRKTEGLAVFLLLPVGIYVAWQNFGNDPVWLILVAVLLSALRPPRKPKLTARRDPSVVIAGAALAAWVLAFPLIQNHGISPLRHLTLNTASYIPMAPERAAMADIHMPALPAHLARGRSNLTEPGLAYAELSRFDEVPEAQTFLGEAIPACQIVTGIKGVLEAIWADVSPAEQPVFIADLVSVHWVLGEGAPLDGGAPWNYGGLAGLDAATHVLVPLCAIDPRARDAILEKLETSGREMTLVRRTPRVLIYTAGTRPPETAPSTR